MNRTICSVLITGILLLPAALTHADLTLTPSISVRETYNDNIFLSHTNEEDEYLTTVSPNIDLQYTAKLLDASISYGLTFRFYKNYDELNDTQIKEIQTTDSQAQIRPFNHFFIDISDTYGRVPVDEREITTEGNDFRNKTDTNQFSISPFFAIPVTPTITATFGYAYSNVWYREDTVLDSSTHSGFIRLSKNFTPSLRGSVNYTYLQYHPDIIDEDGNIYKYYRQEGSVAVFYQLMSNVGVRGELGQAWVNYRSERDDSYNTSFWKIGGNYAFNNAAGTTLDISYHTNFIDSGISGAAKGKRVELTLSSGQVLQFTIKPYHMINQYVLSDRDDTVTGVTVDISRPLSQRISIAFDGMAEKQEFDPGGRKVRAYTVGSSLSYALTQYVTSSIGYRYGERDAQVATDEFENNIAWIELKGTF